MDINNQSYINTFLVKLFVPWPCNFSISIYAQIVSNMPSISLGFKIKQAADNAADVIL